MTLGDEQTIHHIARFDRVATGKTDDAAGATWISHPLDCDSAGLIGFENRSLVAHAGVLANPRVPLDSRSSSSLHPGLLPMAASRHVATKILASMCKTESIDGWGLIDRWVAP